MKMSRTEYLTSSRNAADYMQTYVRERIRDFQDTALGTNPNQGWGRSDEVYNAHNIALTLWHYTNERFLNCRIPEDYASPQALQETLVSFHAMLLRDKQQLEEAMDRLKADSPMTLSMVHENITSCLHAVEETLAQITAAKTLISADAVEISIASTPSPMDRIQDIANRFRDVVRTMSNRRKPDEPLVIKNEYDVQYLFQGLLAMSFNDIRPEEPTPSVSGGSGRGDTLLKSERIVVEYKCTRKGLGEKELRKQIADDFLLYGSQHDCERLFVFIYDTGQEIKNPPGFEMDLERTVDGIDEVRIVVKQ